MIKVFVIGVLLASSACVTPMDVRAVDKSVHQYAFDYHDVVCTTTYFDTRTDVWVEVDESTCDRLSSCVFETTCWQGEW